MNQSMRFEQRVSWYFLCFLKSTLGRYEEGRREQERRMSEHIERMSNHLLKEKGPKRYYDVDMLLASVLLLTSSLK